MIKVVLLGASGSMGKLVGRLAIEDPEIDLVGAFDVNEIGRECAAIVGSSSSCGTVIQHPDELDLFLQNVVPDIAVDFTIAEAAEKNCIKLADKGIKCVIGTTGLSEQFLKDFESKIVQNKAPAVISSNMAIGVNIFFKMASLLASYLEDWDIEIIEAHHHRKRDSPSGTALTAAKVIADALGVKLEDVAKFGRDKGPNKREVGAKKEIGIHAIRGGDIVGDHTILFAGLGERIEFKHQAHSRECLANGAITAIKFLNNVDREDAKIYTTQEALGLID
jgi:4-hydroxy-tetrahydrodipicolinate reductase